MPPPTCVVVPTYWTRTADEARPGDAVYDHPTPVDGVSTLPALLESLEQLDTRSFYLLVLVAVTGPDVNEAAEHKVRELVARHSTCPSLVFGPSQLGWLQSWLEEKGLSGGYLDLRGYPKIRNLQLAIPHALHTETVVALDDDEKVTDPLFLRKAVEPLGTQLDGKRVDGLSGHYLQENGSIFLQVDPAKGMSSNLFDRKAQIMNAAAAQLEEEPGDVVETPFCFGGNMEFSQELMASVGFDPGITRGEDIDYLINARMEGKHFFLRKDLGILHCPPRGGSYKDVSRSKLEQDIIRFIYEREKIHASGSAPQLVPLEAEDLMPYPGEFLAKDIEDDAIAALEQASYPGDAKEFIWNVEVEAKERLKGYLSFRTQWPVLMQALFDDSHVCDHLTKLVSDV